MSNVPKHKRKPSGYQVVDTGQEIYTAAVNLALKMPKRYTYLVLKDFVELAGKVADYTKAGNSVFPTNQHEAQIRRDYFIHAHASLQSLISRTNRFLEIPESLQSVDEDGKVRRVTIGELNSLLHLLLEEANVLRGAMEKDKERFRKLP